MAVNYKSIRDENCKRYGTEIARVAQDFFVDCYDDRTHFIFELLQNAEDALRRRGTCWSGERRVSFDLTQDALTLSHFGIPFDEADVEGICNIGKSTKDEHSIGRFGIGFKSVYAFTDCPEIHSGADDFAIRDYVHPSPADRIDRDPAETLIVLPLKADNKTAGSEIVDGFKRLGPSVLLFLRSTEEINWSVQDDASGFYLRDKPEPLGENVHRINLIGKESGQEEVDEHWLVFRRKVFLPEGEAAGRVEVAFSLQASKEQPDKWNVVPVATSPLVVFFPTVVETGLGFLVQGPYRTTPNRDNIRRNDPWNKSLVEKTVELLIEAMRWLRDQSMLDTSALGCLPLDPKKFPDGSIFAPMFGAVCKALREEPLMPGFGGGYIAASKSRLARTKELRELFDPKQVAMLFGGDVAGWLAGDITQDRTPELRQYLMQELGVAEVTPATVVTCLTADFLKAQTDEWIVALYEFLNGQGTALQRQLGTVPLVRLVDGCHVTARQDGKPRVFLPGTLETGFPTVRPSVCTTDKARQLLESLGITKPDPVDDVILNLLPKYLRDEVDVDANQYASDVARILKAYETDSKVQRKKLVSELQETRFVMVIDAGDGKEYMDKPGNIYLATERLKQLFAGVSNVMIVDGAYDCLRGEPILELLEACGALRYPRPVATPYVLSHDELQKIRRDAGHEETSGRSDKIEDWCLHGFEDLLKILPTLAPEQWVQRGCLIWESLGDLDERRGRRIFNGNYSWTHYSNYTKDFPSAFVRRLNEAAWVPDKNGNLQPPHQVIFDSLDWKTNQFLLTKIAFKSPVIKQLAEAAGVDPEAVDILREFSISAADLLAYIGTKNQPPENEGAGEPEAEGDASPADETDVCKDVGNILSSAGGGSGNRGNLSDSSGGWTPGASAARAGAGGSAHQKAAGGQGGRRPGGNGDHPFISYIGAHPEDEKRNPDGLDQAKRMQLEARAIDKIVQLEPTLNRTEEGNRGFDLYEADESGNAFCWVEVKSMTGSWNDRPVGMSRAQFDLASEKGDAYWLYVVEHASGIENARILKIQNPAGHARTFTFDRGWISIAEADPKV